MSCIADSTLFQPLKTKLKLLVGFVLVLATACPALAQPVAQRSNSIRTAVKKPKVAEPIIDNKLSLTLQTLATVDTQKPTMTAGYNTLELVSTYTPWDVFINGIGAFYQDYSMADDEGDTITADDPILSFGKRFRTGRDFNETALDLISVSVRTSLPGNKFSHANGFIGSVGPQVLMKKKISRFDLLAHFRYIKHFYDRELKPDGTPNSPDISRVRLRANVDLTQTISLQTSFSYLHYRSFNDTYKGFEAASLGFGYASLENLSFALGVLTERFTTESNGEEHIQLYNSAVSQFFFDIGLSI